MTAEKQDRVMELRILAGTVTRKMHTLFAELYKTHDHEAKVALAIAIQRCREVLKHTNAVLEVLDESVNRRKVISASIGHQYYIVLAPAMCGFAGYTLVEATMLKACDTSADQEPMIWLVEAMNGRN